jgi:hypothetical protein
MSEVTQYGGASDNAAPVINAYIATRKLGRRVTGTYSK